MDSVIVPITQELKCMQKLVKRVRHFQMARLFESESEMYAEELKARNLAIWREPDYRYCK